MILRHIADAVRAQNWFTVVIELVIVVAGILIAVEIDEWNNRRKNAATERAYLERLVSDLENDVVQFDQIAATATRRLAMANLLIKAVTEPLDDDKLAHLARATRGAGFSSRPIFTDHTFEELKSSGQLQQIRSPDVRQQIYSYYGEVSERAQYEFIRQNIQTEYLNRSVGLLTAEQAERYWLGNEELNSIAEAQDILERMRAKPSYVEYLPRLLTFQHSFIRDAASLKQQALALLDVLEKELQP